MKKIQNFLESSKRFHLMAWSSTALTIIVFACINHFYSTMPVWLAVLVPLVIYLVIKPLISVVVLHPSAKLAWLIITIVLAEFLIGAMVQIISNNSNRLGETEAVALNAVRKQQSQINAVVDRINERIDQEPMLSRCETARSTLDQLANRAEAELEEQKAAVSVAPLVRVNSRQEALALVANEQAQMSLLSGSSCVVTQVNANRVLINHELVRYNQQVQALRPLVEALLKLPSAQPNTLSLLTQFWDYLSTTKFLNLLLLITAVSMSLLHQRLLYRYVGARLLELLLSEQNAAGGIPLRDSLYGLNTQTDSLLLVIRSATLADWMQHYNSMSLPELWFEQVRPDAETLAELGIRCDSEALYLLANRKLAVFMGLNQFVSRTSTSQPNSARDSGKN